MAAATLYRSSVVILVCCAIPVDSWGTRFELLKGGCHLERTMLRLFPSCNNEDERLPHTETSYTLHFESKYDLVDGEMLKSRLFISKPFVLESSMFGIANPYDVPHPSSQTTDEPKDPLAACGEECEECEIPEEYKEIGRQSPVDVMEFLGLQRAAPISINHVAEFDWE